MCDCDSEYEGCIGRLQGFDYLEHADWTSGPGGPMDWTVDGTPVSIDVASLPAASPKSAWYAPLWAALPAGFTVTVITDAAANSSAKPVFEFSYSGPVPVGPVVITRNTGTPGDEIVISVDASGNATMSWLDDNDDPLLSSAPLMQCDGTADPDGDGIVSSSLSPKSGK